MSTITLRQIKGRELAARLAEELRLDPERTYRVTVLAEDEELATAESLDQVMETIGKRAEKRGLTRQVLEDILGDS